MVRISHDVKTFLTVASALCLGLAAVAYGQDDAERRDNGRTDARAQQQDSGKPADDILRGPRVRERAQERGTHFGPSQRRMRAGADEQALAPRMWLRVFRSIDMNPETQARATELVAQFRRERIAHLRENAEALAELREELSSIRQQMQRPRDGDEAADFDALHGRIRTLNEEVAAIQQRGPQPEALQKQLWDILDEAEQGAFQARLEEAKARIAEVRRLQREGAAADTRDNRQQLNDRRQQRLRLLRQRQSERGGEQPARPMLRDGEQQERNDARPVRDRRNHPNARDRSRRGGDRPQ